MHKKILEYFKIVFLELKTPSNQGKDWYLWASVQMAHSFIGMLLTGVIYAFGVDIFYAFLSASLAYIFLKETFDFAKSPIWPIARDSLHDSLFVIGGGLVCYSLISFDFLSFIIASLLIVCGLIWGILVRIERS